MSAIIIKSPFLFSLSLSIWFSVRIPSFPAFSVYFPKKKRKSLTVDSHVRLFTLPYIQWYFNIANELLAFHYDDTYYYFHFFIYCLFILYYSSYFITTLFNLFNFRCHQEKSAFMLHFLHIAYFDYITLLLFVYAFWYFLEIAIFARCNVRGKINRSFYTSFYSFLIL